MKGRTVTTDDLYQWISKDTGVDVDHVLLYDAPAHRMMERRGDGSPILMGQPRRSRHLREIGFRECLDCGELIHDGALTCGNCGSERR